MRDRTFADFMAGAIACLSVLGCFAVLRESARAAAPAELGRWALPRTRRRHSPEDDCRHCTGSGACEECAPAACRVCKGTGLHPRDQAVVSRLRLLWDGAA
jgi:hypothetical protein